MRLYIAVLLFANVLYLASCRQTNTFNTRRGGFDYIRIPLIKPYEALLLNGKKEWGMNLYNGALNSSIVNIKSVNIVNHAILLNSRNTNLNGQKINEAWFVVIPSKHIEQGFASHKDYVKFLNENGIIVEPKLYDINFISDYFDSHYPINWESINQ